MADGTIVFSTELDNEELEKDYQKAVKKVRGIEADLESDQRKKLPLQQKLEQLTVQADAAAAKLDKMKNAPIGTYSDQQIREQEETVRALGARWDAVQKQVANYDKRIQTATEKLDQAKSDAGEVAQQLAKAGPSTEHMKKAMEKAEKSARKFSLRLREVVRSALVFTLISQGLAELREWVGGLIKTNDEARASVARLKAALLTMAQPLVDVIIPGFIKFTDVLTAAVITIGQLFAMISGKSYEETKSAAEALNKEQDAIEGVGESAKEAEKQLASFDEINKLSGERKSADYIAPDFSGLGQVEIPEWLADLTITVSDVLFDWNDLSAADVIEKIVVGLGGIGLAGVLFSVGGLKGAAIGMLAGTAITSAIWSFLFDDDGKLDSEEIVKSLVTALGTAVGTALGFKIGGLKGAAIGATLGSSVTATVLSLLFDDNGELGTEEILSTLVSALFAVVGGVIGFKVGGGAKGAALGATVGMAVGALISDLLFDNDGVLSEEEVGKTVVSALGGLVGGVLGFAIGGGPGGAFIGMTVGSAATIMLADAIFDGDGKLSEKEVLESLCAAAGAIVGAAIGFAVGGPMGAAIGLTVGAVLTVVIKDVVYEWFGDIKKYNPDFTGFGPDYSWMFGKTSSVASGTKVPATAAFATSPTENIRGIAESVVAAMQQNMPTQAMGAQGVSITVKAAPGLTRYLKYEIDAESYRQGDSLIGGAK